MYAWSQFYLEKSPASFIQDEDHEQREERTVVAWNSTNGLKTKDTIICLPNSLMIFLHFQASNSPVFNWWGQSKQMYYLPRTKPQVIHNKN